MRRQLVCAAAAVLEGPHASALPSQLLKGKTGMWEVVVGLEIHAQSA